MVGRNTAAHDDPLLMARPPGPRTATRIVIDSQAQTSLESQLVRTANAAPVLVAVGPEAEAGRCLDLVAAGCEVWQGREPDPARRLEELLVELGCRKMTNVLVEGGGRLLGSFFDLDQIDEAHVFVTSKLLGGETAVTPIGGRGIGEMSAVRQLDRPTIEMLEGDVYIHGPMLRAMDPDSPEIGSAG